MSGAMLTLLVLFMACLGGATQASEPVRLIFVGDVMLDDGPGRTVASGIDPLADFAPLLAEADYRVANLECPIATTGQALANKPWTFRAHPRVLPILQRHFDAVAVSNNHAGDYGKAAFMETLGLLEQHGIRHFGGGVNLTAAHAPLWIERKGLRIALLGYNEFKPRSFEAGPDWPGIAWSEDSQVIADIRAARAAGADVVIPFMHWGWEMEPNPDARQRQLAHAMIDAGAAMVIGGHPHVTQGSELYKGRPIVYSLGNFVFDGFDSPQARLGWLLRVSADRDGIASWDVVEATLDEQGSPHRLPGGAGPCAKRGDAVIQACSQP